MATCSREIAIAFLLVWRPTQVVVVVEGHRGGAGCPAHTMRFFCVCVIMSLVLFVLVLSHGPHWTIPKSHNRVQEIKR